jgi:hypothetical protein
MPRCFLRVRVPVDEHQESKRFQALQKETTDFRSSFAQVRVFVQAHWVANYLRKYRQSMSASTACAEASEKKNSRSIESVCPVRQCQSLLKRVR